MARFNLEPIMESIMKQAEQATLNETNRAIVIASIEYLRTAQSNIAHVDSYNKFLALQNAQNKIATNIKLQKKPQLEKNEKLLTNKQINRYNNIINKYSGYESLESAKEAILGKYYNQDVEEAFRNLMIATQSYQKDILKIKDISMTTVFAINVEGAVIVYEETQKTDPKKTFYMDVAHDGGGLVARYKTAISALNELYKSTTYSTDSQENKDEYTRVLTEAYLILLKRIEMTKMKNSNKIFIPYNYQGNKKIAQISARGDLAEAYLKLILNKSNSQSLNVDSAIEMLLQGAAEVSSLSGMFVGDFDIQRENKKIQIAAKSLNASLAGYKQVIQFAKKTVALATSNKITDRDKAFEALIQKKSSSGGTRNKLDVQLDDLIKKQIEAKLEEAINIVSL